MKNLQLIFITVLTLISINAFAQLKPHAGIRIINTSSVSSSVESETSNAAIIGVGYKFGNKFYVEPALQYTYIKNKLTSKSNPQSFTDSEVQVARIPVMLGYNFHHKSPESKVKTRIFSGPSASFIFSSKTNGTTSEIPNFNYAQFGWNFGLGVDWRKLYVEFNYEFGLSNLYDTNPLDTDGIKVNSLNITVGANLF